MKQEFQMEQSEMDDIIAINTNMPPVMKFGDYWSGMDLKEKINHYWETLGDKYGFKHMTVEPSAKGKLYFLAEPKLIEVQKTESEIAIEEYIGDAMGYLNYSITASLRKIVYQLEIGGYECEGGYLVNDVAFLALKKLSNPGK